MFRNQFGQRSMSLLVIGGNGFVGRGVCRAAVKAGIPTASLSRRGAPSNPESCSWQERVQWITGDALDVSTVENAIAQTGCTGVISTAGTLVDGSHPSVIQDIYSNFKVPA